MSDKRKRVLSGMRPTGPLHIGHLVGALENWVRLQDQADCYFVIVDWHALTTDYADSSQLRKHVREVTLDWLAAGLDPEKCSIFIQSHVKEHAELHLLLSMTTPLPWLERVPSFKEQQEQLREKDINTYGFLGYPLLQAADILLYMADAVPVGEDQVPHLELTREIARRFNHIYRDLLIEPQALLTKNPRLPGTDGRKMSKSYNNAIYLSDTPKSIEKKINSMLTDPQRSHRDKPGNPEVCPVFDNHKVFSPKETQAWADQGCRTADIGCRDCKAALTERVQAKLSPIAEKRKIWEENPKALDSMLEEGAARARRVAMKTMDKVRRAMKLPK